ncbi:glycosyltransferase [Kordiimonas sp. SCSIO 12603]|uniref:glycosyltransferase family 2 protein n=1 Tax=Kordiimonas sp. SCSIO 12603 TaxID=2829596 RepID=UPI0021083D97|nr:glycosyltransferase [Kordiimonas sp. SCSIO 12603]UTW59683.1 glycosyltransferase [Kordiimonas sp. SCSIO 12603]
MVATQAEWNERLVILKILSRAKKNEQEQAGQIAINAAKDIVLRNVPRISVIMPMWNRQNIVIEAIQSVLDQSFRPYELIISDDGSVDDSVKTVENSFPQEINSGLIKIIKNSENKGAAHARNLAQQIATGDLIAYLDTDNKWRKNYLLMMAGLFAQEPELNCAYAALFVTNKDENKQYVLAQTYDRARLLSGNFIDMNVFIHRRKLIDKLGGFNVDIERIEDWEMILRYTQEQIPPLLPMIGTDYLIDTKNLGNMSTTRNYTENFRKVYNIHHQEMEQYGVKAR